MTCKRIHGGGVVCTANTSVPGETECREALWSNMRACRKCDHPTCYRTGMTVKEAGADNARLVGDEKVTAADIRRINREWKRKHTHDKAVAELAAELRAAYEAGEITLPDGVTVTHSGEVVRQKRAGST
ncbi:MAG: hypothetical protein ACYTAO_17665, partial [Planctomycetota bacterium]